MKISTISPNMSQSVNYINRNQNYNRVSFGFGPECSDDDYLAPNNYEHREGSGNVFDYFRLLGELAASLIRENMPEPRCRFGKNMLENWKPVNVADEDCDDDIVINDEENIDKDLDEAIENEDETKPQKIETDEEAMARIMATFQDVDFDDMFG